MILDPDTTGRPANKNMALKKKRVHFGADSNTLFAPGGKRQATPVAGVIYSQCNLVLYVK
jgi:hypothetical protein